ncbi:MAG: hypothetical protein ACRDJ4_01100 [Actinomycetota bacterium]
MDAASGILLRRLGLDERGKAERLLTFVDLEEPYSAGDGDFDLPHAKLDRADEADFFPAAIGDIGEPSLSIPRSVPAGYELQSGARFVAGGERILHLIYSDGLETVSLFVQPGRVAVGSLPALAYRIRLKSADGYAWPGFPRGLSWQAGAYTLMLVGAAPTGELREIADALPQGPLHRSLARPMSDLLR